MTSVSRKVLCEPGGRARHSWQRHVGGEDSPVSQRQVEGSFVNAWCGSGSENGIVGSFSQRYGSGSFYHQAKIVRKPFIPAALWLLFDFLSLKSDVNVPSISNKQKNFILNLFFVAILKVETKIAGSGSISQRHGSSDPDPDPHQMSWIHTTTLLEKKKKQTKMIVLILFILCYIKGLADCLWSSFVIDGFYYIFRIRTCVLRFPSQTRKFQWQYSKLYLNFLQKVQKPLGLFRLPVQNPFNCLFSWYGTLPKGNKIGTTTFQLLAVLNMPKERLNIKKKLYSLQEAAYAWSQVM